MNNSECGTSRLPTVSASHTLPVTALQYLADGSVLSGEGSLLCVNRITLDSRARQAAFRIFESQAIHGVEEVDQTTDGSVTTTTLIVFGGRLLRIVQIEQNEQGIWQARAGRTLESDDWILDVAISASATSDASPAIALVTAHDALWLLRSTSPGDAPGQQWALACAVKGSNTILYSAHALWTDDGRILVASGTAFGDVILWSCLPKGLVPTVRETHFTFSAHEGSIFGIRISNIVQKSLPSPRARLLASSSDDRTVRVWDISTLPSNVSTSAKLLRDTGFGAKASESESARPPLLSKVMGHLSRIWHVRFLDEEGRLPAIRSFGEDASTITWLLSRSETADALPFTMSATSTMHLHTGKNIWSVAQSKDGHIATGGADGAIALISPTALQQLSLYPLLPAVVDACPRTADFLKSYTFLDSHHLCTISQHGRVQIFRLSSGGAEMVRSLDQPELTNHSMVASVPGTVFACGGQGNIFAYSIDDNGHQIISHGNGKVTGLLASSRSKDTAVRQETTGQPQMVGLLRSTVQGTTQLIVVDACSDLSACHTLYDLLVDVPAGFVPTSLLTPTMTSKRIIAYIGSRNGSIGILDATSEDLARGALVMQQVLDIHGDAITSMTWHDSDKRTPGRGHLLTTSRDGSHAIFQVESPTPQSARRLICVHKLHLPFGPNIEGLAILDKENILVWGFRNKYFVVYSVTKHIEVMAVDCGGVHRTWAFVPSVHGGTFVWTKASEVFVVEQKAPRFRLLNAGGHGREIKSLARASTSVGTTIVATGAEDTCIRIFETSLAGAGLRCLQVLRKHNTGPQQISFSDCGQYMFSSGGFEEFNIWRLERDCPLIGTGVICESQHPRSGKSDLRITSFSVDGIAPGKGWKIAMTYSDSRVGIWHYSEQKWQLIIEADYLTACPNGIYSCSTSNAEEMRLVTSATDGHIALWRYQSGDAGPPLKWYSRHRIHQSAVLATAVLDRHHRADLLLVSGGDDNAITFTRLERDLEAADSTTVLNAHAAAVTGLLVVNREENHGPPIPESEGEQHTSALLLSVGLDQRLIVWRLEVDWKKPGMSGLRLLKQQALNTSVADASGIELCWLAGDDPKMRQALQVIVAGIGMQVLTISGV